MASLPVLARRLPHTSYYFLHLQHAVSRLPIRHLPAFQPISSPAMLLPALGSTFTNLRELLGDLWDSLLKAVPKKKTTYSRKRTRQLAGKALKDVQGVVPCAACGRPKRPHFLCEHCAILATEMWRGHFNKFKPREPKLASSEPAERQALKAPSETDGAPEGSNDANPKA